MKFYIATFFLILTSINTKADDLTFNVKNTIKGGSTGSIDLTISGGTGPYVINWTGPNGFTAKTEDIDNLAIGTYTITVNDNYCGTATTMVVVKDFTVGMEELNADDVVVFPNPASGDVKIVLPELLMHSQIRLITVLGDVVMEQQNVTASTSIVDISTFSPGVYLIEIVKDGMCIKKKIMKY